MKKRTTTICNICGKEYETKMQYADYGLVKLDGKGDTQIEFDACKDCLPKVVDAIKVLLTR